MHHYWLLVSTPLKYISQWEGLSHILWNIKFMFQTTNQINIKNHPSEKKKKRFCWRNSHISDAFWSCPSAGAVATDPVAADAGPGKFSGAGGAGGGSLGAGRQPITGY